MKAKQLVQELNGNEAIAALEQFLKEFDSSNNSLEMVTDLLDENPNFDKLLQLLDQEKRTCEELAVIYNVLGSCLMRCFSADNKYEAVGLHVTRFILQKYNKHLITILKPSNSNTCIISGLKIITGMVVSCLGSASEVVRSLSFNRIEFTSFAKKESEVRNQFLYMILAFLSIKDETVSAYFVNANPEILTCVFEALPNDPFEIVVKFFNLLRNVVMNMYINKTTKTKIFNGKTSQYLTIFYFHNSDKSLDIPFTIKEREKLRTALHSLMIPLCSDLKCGVIFRDTDNKTTYGKHKNMHVYQILSTIRYPWQLEEGRELILCILKACPDVMSLFMELVKGHLTQREHYGFFSLIKLFIMLIEKNDSWKDIEKFEKGFEKNFFFIPLLHRGKITSMIENNSIVSQHMGLLLIISYLKKAREGIEFIEKITNLNEELRKTFKEKIRGCIKKLGYDINKIFHIWYMVLKEEYEIPQWFTQECSSKYNLLLDLSEYIYNYIELFGYNVFRLKFNPLNMLQNVNNLSIVDINVKFNIIINILKVLLTAQKQNNFEAFGFSLSRMEDEEDIKINEKFYIFLVHMYYISNSTTISGITDKNKNELKNLSLQLLKSSVDNWGLSEYCENYVEIWLCKISNENSKECSNFFAKIISKTITNFFSYLDVMTAISSELEDKESYSQINVLDFVNRLNPSIKVEDNEEVDVKGIKIPFSCLILGAVDVLKEDNNNSYLIYFMNVIEDYLHRVDNPSVLSRFLLEKNIFKDNMSDYLYYWSTRQPFPHTLFPEKDATSRLKNIFVSGCLQEPNDCFLTDSDNHIELEEICRQIYVYIQSEFEAFQKGGDKKKLKYFLKIFRKLIQLSHKKANMFVQLFEHLINHPFTLRNYEPFSSSTMVYKDIENYIVLVVLEKYPELHRFMKPFIDKLISCLKLSFQIEEDKLILPLSMFLNNYSELNYNEVEEILFSLLQRDTGTLFESINNITMEFFELLKNHSSVYRQPSSHLTLEVIKKIIQLARHSKSSDVQLQYFNLLSSYMTIFFKPDIVLSLTYDDTKNILKSRVADENLCKMLLHLCPDVRLKLLDTLNNNMKTHLSCQVPFVLSFIKENTSKTNSLIDSCLLKMKDSLLEWALNFNSINNDDYRSAIEIMLSKEMFELSDILDICKKFCSETKQLPLHILSLKPFFDYLADKHYNANNNNENDGLIPLPSHSYVHLLSILMNIVAKTYRKENVNSKFIGKIAETMLDIIPKVEKKYIRRGFYTNKLWLSFVKKVLKESLNDNENGPNLLSVVIQLITPVYSKKKAEDCIIPLNLFYQMLRSHSQYIAVMLNENSNRLKEETSLLQLTLIQHRPDICEERHIPILLGAYGASRSLCDQYILKTLYLYEKEGFMPTYDPTLWGPTAVSHFAVEKRDEASSTNVSYQAPRVKQTLSLIDCDKVIETALNFDAELGLEPLTIVQQDETILYDQRFLLSLFLHFTRVDHRLSVMYFLEKGVLALGIAALSSHRDEVWKAGAAILQYIVSMFENSKFYNLKLQWIWLVAVLGYGLEGKKQRVPSVITTFLIKASQMLLCPRDVLYKPVMNYLYLKSSLSIHKIPELYNLLFSSDFQYNKEHRAFLLEILSTGIKDELDIEILKSSFFPKLLLAVTKAPSTNSYLRVLGMKVLKSMVRISSGAHWLVVENGLLEELPHMLKPFTTCPVHRQSNWIESSVDILSSVWHTWKETKFESNNSHETFDSKSGLKRELEENSDKAYNCNSLPKKKRKLANGQYSINDDSEDKKKVKKVAEEEYLKIFRCLGSIFSKIMNQGTIETVSKTFDLLKDIVNYFEIQKQNSPRTMDVNFIKYQFENWIKKSEFVKRFQGQFDDDDAISFGVKNVSEDWKCQPLSSFTHRISSEVNLKNLIHKRKELLETLYIKDA